jgi:hypothetical protein
MRLFTCLFLSLDTYNASFPAADLLAIYNVSCPLADRAVFLRLHRVVWLRIACANHRLRFYLYALAKKGDYH